MQLRRSSQPGTLGTARVATRIYERRGSRRRHCLHRVRRTRLAASPGAPAYCSAKAAEVPSCALPRVRGSAARHLRANTVNPDAVLRGWAPRQGERRCAARRSRTKWSESELEEVYRQRLLLKLSVLPQGHRRSGSTISPPISPLKRHWQHPQRRCQICCELHPWTKATANGSQPCPIASPRPSSARRTPGSPPRRQRTMGGLAATVAPAFDIETITGKVAAFAGRRADLGVGTGRYVLCALSRARRARADPSAQARGLRDHPPTHTRDPRLPRVTRGGGPKSWLRGGIRSRARRRDVVNSNTFQDQPGQNDLSL